MADDIDSLSIEIAIDDDDLVVKLRGGSDCGGYVISSDRIALSRLLDTGAPPMTAPAHLSPEEVARNLTKAQRGELLYLTSSYNRSLGRMQYGQVWNARVEMSRQGLVVRSKRDGPYWLATDLGRRVAALLREPTE